MSKPRKSRAQGNEEARQQIEEALIPEFENPNPLKRTIKVKQFTWTARQKEFFKVALDRDTRVVFVNGPAGTAKSLLSVYCGLQLLNMKVISDCLLYTSELPTTPYV